MWKCKEERKKASKLMVDWKLVMPNVVLHPFVLATVSKDAQCG